MQSFHTKWLPEVTVPYCLMKWGEWVRIITSWFKRELTPIASNVKERQVNHSEHLRSWKLYFALCSACNAAGLMVTIVIMWQLLIYCFDCTIVKVLRLPSVSFRNSKSMHDECQPSETCTQWNATAKSRAINANYVGFLPFQEHYKHMKEMSFSFWQHDSLLQNS